jgi:hypothetical protein
MAGGVMVRTCGTGMARSDADGAVADTLTLLLPLPMESVTVAMSCELVEALLGATSGKVSPLLGAGAALEDGAGCAIADVC